VYPSSVPDTPVHIRPGQPVSGSGSRPGGDVYDASAGVRARDRGILGGRVRALRPGWQGGRGRRL
jgi:hypothetical protein